MKINSSKYDIELVISSVWRKDMDITINTLIDNGILLPNTIGSTPITSTPQFRGKEILMYLKDNKFSYPQDDFVIIDDESFDYDKYFEKNKIIKTNGMHQSLNTEMIKKYLSNNPNSTIDFEIEKE